MANLNINFICEPQAFSTSNWAKVPAALPLPQPAQTLENISILAEFRQFRAQ